MCIRDRCNTDVHAPDAWRILPGGAGAASMSRRRRWWPMPTGFGHQCRLRDMGGAPVPPPQPVHFLKAATEAAICRKSRPRCNRAS
eukprot:13013337-Alexandrium_andersonii.AAC.1